MKGETSCVGPGACYTVVKRQYRDYYESVPYTDLHSHNRELNSLFIIISDSYDHIRQSNEPVPFESVQLGVVHFCVRVSQFFRGKHFGGWVGQPKVPERIINREKPVH